MFERVSFAFANRFCVAKSDPVTGTAGYKAQAKKPRTLKQLKMECGGKVRAAGVHGCIGEIKKKETSGKDRKRKKRGASKWKSSPKRMKMRGKATAYA
jgi:hypothetical protein